MEFHSTNVCRNKVHPDGYKLFALSWDPKTGQPVHPSSSTSAVISVLENKDNSICPGRCIRPTGIVFGPGGRLYMASEKTGEIYVIGRADGSSVDSTTLETQATSRFTDIEFEQPEEEAQIPEMALKVPGLVKPRSPSPWESLWNMFGGVRMERL
jgi:hypothetical protein